MAAPRLSILPFLQSWDAPQGRLTVNLLLVPVGDPAQPLGPPTAPAFQGTALRLAAHISDDPGRVATLADVPAGPQLVDLAPVQ